MQTVALHAYQHDIIILATSSTSLAPCTCCVPNVVVVAVAVLAPAGQGPVCEHQPHSAAVKMRNSMLILMCLALLSTVAPGESAQHSSRVQDTLQMQHCRQGLTGTPCSLQVHKASVCGMPHITCTATQGLRQQAAQIALLQRCVDSPSLSQSSCLNSRSLFGTSAEQDFEASRLWQFA